MYTLTKSPNKLKKYRINYENKNIDFGQAKASDYTIHNDKRRLLNYLQRHKKNEDWTKTGLLTRGFWARWLLWNKETIEDSIKDIEDNFKIKIKSNI